MTPEEEPGRQTWLTTQKEQERERRRLRDRQRRQSMSIEEREKHLARRRRNYQLRRQRTGLGLGSDREMLLDSQQKQTSITSTSKINIMYENQEAVFLPERGSPDDAVVAITDSCNVGIPSESDMNYGGGKAGEGHEMTNFPRRLRVKQIRHLARLLNTPIGEFSGEVQQIADVNAEQSVIRKSKSRKSLRLIHVKRLARALNSTMGKTFDQNHLNESQGPALSMAPMEDQQCIQL